MISSCFRFILYRISVGIDSTGVQANSYDLALKVTSVSFSSGVSNDTARRLAFESHSIVTDIPIDLTVDAIADPATTFVEVDPVAGGPTLGRTWVDKALIWLHDLDGYRITTDTGQDFRVELETTDHKASCDAYFDASRYVVKCVVPDSPQAGLWNLTVELGDTKIYSAALRAKCPSEKYESLDGACEKCLQGALCESDGTSISNVVIKPDYWRSDPSSSYIYSCPYKNACLGTDGSTGGNNGTAGSSGGCNVGFVGPLCASCDVHFFVSWSEKTCKPCQSGASHTSRWASPRAASDPVKSLIVHLDCLLPHIATANTASW